MAHMTVSEITNVKIVIGLAVMRIIVLMIGVPLRKKK